MNSNVLNALLAGLSQEEATELQSLLVYLAEKGGPGNPSGHLPEGSIASVINRASPAVRQKMQMISDIVETPRHMPFEEKFSEAEWFKRLGADVPTSLTIKSALDGQEVASKLQERMGTDSQLPQKPISDREIISAAMAKHGA